jgi:iron complex outermembrane recepter protein
MSHTVVTVGVFALCALLLPRQPVHAANVDPLTELKRMSVDELLNVEVTSVSRREEGLRNAAAAVAVITRDDLRRSGATTLPEALRLVPGLHVGRQNSNTWAVSSRGFSSVNSEKLLVLSDTRSIYTPLFSGVLWDVQDYLFENVERIEVIRGPGAALWGSNAVNGVINVTTRSARDTHGDYLEAAAGDFERFTLGARHGGESAGGKHYRVSAHYVDRDASRSPVTVGNDAWKLAHVAFRTDWDGEGADTWTVQGDAYSGEIGQLAPAVQVQGRAGPQPPLVTDVSGGNVLARWRRQSSEVSDLQLRAYYDYARRDDPSFDDTLHTFDVDLQQRFSPRSRHQLIWGVAARLTSNRNRSGGIFAVDPETSEDILLSGFIQDQFAISDDVELTLGTKFEHNDFSGFEVQPSIRAAWSLTPAQTVWAAVSRAVRVPTRLERDVAISVTDPAGNPVVQLLGNPDFDVERLVAHELGYRWLPRANLSFDIALFYNDYDGLASLEFGAPFADGAGRTIIPIINRNLTSGRSKGAELLAEWQPTSYWRLSTSYSHVDLELASRGQDINRGVWFDGATPRSQVGLRSLLTLAAFEFDAQLRRHTRIRRLPVDTSGAGIDAYSALDLRVGWQAAPEWRLSLVGQNLLDERHIEFGTPAARGALERAVYLKAEWRRE